MNAKLHSLLLFQSPRRCFSSSSTSNPMLCQRNLGSVVTHSSTTIPSPPSPSGPVNKRSAQSSVSQWKGLEQWRSSPIDERRVWGRNTPVQEKEPVLGGGLELSRQNEHPQINVAELAKWGEHVLLTTDPLEKAFLTHQAFRLWNKGGMQIGIGVAPDAPGRPSKPELVPPREVPGPKDCDLSASAHLLHNLAHIELNAIDLAWDTVVRFSYASGELGRQFFADFLHVADDESRHFRWCQQRLNELGFSYGDMPAHNLLWKDCIRTSGSVKSRLAVIPMMQEARGLDAGPRLVKRLSGLADHRSSAIVRRIGEEEVAHVGVGVFWFMRVCEQLNIDPGFTFKEMMAECEIELHGPFNHTARARAGLQREWYDKPESTESSGTEKEGRSKQIKEDPPKRIGNKESVRNNQTREEPGVFARSKRAERESSETMIHKEKPLVQAQGKTQETENVSATLHASTIDDVTEVVVADAKIQGTSNNFLPEVYERLAILVAMEKGNAGV